MNSPQTGRALVNGTELYYEVWGPPAGQPVVLTHGFSGNAASWQAQVDALAERYRVVTYDARGHAWSGVPASESEYAEEQYVEDLYQLLRHLGIERACLGGLSMGGNITLRFGLAHPEMVAGLIVCDAGAGSDDPAAWGSRSRTLAGLIESRGLKAFAELSLRSPMLSAYAKQGPEIAERMRRVLTGHDPAGLIRVLHGEQATRPSLYTLAPRLRTFERPILVIVGEHDQIAWKPCLFLAETLPDAELCVIPGAGHLTSMEAPAAFNAAVERFLARIWPA